MSMLRYFFETGTDKTLFDGLYISQNKPLCEEYTGKFPVVFLSLKGVEGLTFDEAIGCGRKNIYCELISLHEEPAPIAAAKLRFALKKLSELLYKHYGKKTIILIDEYDVPLDKAFQHGYYKEMVSLIRGLLGESLKTNEFLQFAILTGCLRISKESIFTGLNNFKILSITDTRFDELFGFTEKEVIELLETYHLDSHLAETKEWHDGYHFGDADIYCPWDVMNHVDRLCSEQGEYKLVIPNKEIKEVYKLQIQKWFDDTVLNNTEQLTDFWNSLKEGNTKAIETYLNRTLSNSIRVFDTKSPDKEKESSYHTFLLGLLAGNSDWLVKSNIEAGDGFADIIVETEDTDAGIIFELKYSKEASGLDKACEHAIMQIKDWRYSEYLANDGRHNLLLYGIAFYKKRCKVAFCL